MRSPQICRRKIFQPCRRKEEAKKTYWVEAHGWKCVGHCFWGIPYTLYTLQVQPEYLRIFALKSKVDFWTCILEKNTEKPSSDPGAKTYPFFPSLVLFCKTKCCSWKLLKKWKHLCANLSYRYALGGSNLNVSIKNYLFEPASRRKGLFMKVYRWTLLGQFFFSGIPLKGLTSTCPCKTDFLNMHPWEKRLQTTGAKKNCFLLFCSLCLKKYCLWRLAHGKFGVGLFTSIYLSGLTWGFSSKKCLFEPASLTKTISDTLCY